MKQLNILVVAEIFFPDTIGGSGRVVYEVSKRLAEKGHNIYILAPKRNKKLPEKEFLEGFWIYRYSIPFLGPYQIFLQIMRGVPLDLINFHQPFSGLSISSSRKAKKIPKIYTFHSPWHREYEIKTGKKGINSLIRKYMEGSVLNRCKKIIVLSEYSKRELLDAHKVCLERIVVIPGGVDTEEFKPPFDKKEVRRKLHIPQDKFLLLTIRNLVPRMGLNNLVTAMSDVVKERRDVLLIIGGEGFLRGKLEALIKELRLEDYVKLVGEIREGQLPLYYQAADLFILPTRHLEGFGLVTLEALASGTPVIGTPVGGTKEILGELNRELLIEGTDAYSISRLILKFMKSDRPDNSYRYRQFVVENYSWEKIVSRIERVYSGVLNNSH